MLLSAFVAQFALALRSVLDRPLSVAAGARVLDFTSLTASQLRSRFGWVRTGAGTMEESDSDLVYGAHNLLLHSGDFTQAIWYNGSDGASIPSVWGCTPVAGPFAGAQGYAVQKETADSIVQNFVVEAGQSYSFAIWIRTAAGTGDALIAAGDLTPVVVTCTTTWQQILCSGVAPSSGNRQHYITLDGGVAYEIAAASMNLGAVTSYVQTTTAPVFLMRTPDYTHGVPGLLLEGQRTNLLGKTEQFDDAYWSKQSALITANAGVAPDGTATADKLIGSTADNLAHFIQKTGLSSAVSVLSFYAKADGETVVSGWLVNDSVGASFNLSAGTTALLGATASGITDEGDGWYRCWVYSSTATTSAAIYLRTGSGFVSDGVSGALLWGAQLEAGAYPTSYIPNSGTGTVTRAADVAEIGPGAEFDALFPAAQGTIVVEWVDLGAEISDIFMLRVSGSISESIGFYRSGGVLFWSRAGGTNQLVGSVGPVNPLGQNKAAFSWGPTGLHACMNGRAGVSNESSVIPAVTGARFAGATLISGGVPNWKPTKITTLPTQTTGAALQALTTLPVVATLMLGGAALMLGGVPLTLA